MKKSEVIKQVLVSAGIVVWSYYMMKALVLGISALVMRFTPEEIEKEEA